MIKNLAFLACRLFALYALFQVVVWGVYIYEAPHLPPALTAGSYSLLALVPVASLLLGIFCWCKAEWLAALIVGNHDVQADGSRDMTLSGVQTIGFCILGMFLLADAIPSAAYMASLLLMHATAYYNITARCVLLGVQCVLGIWLLLGASWFTRLIEKYRKG